MLFTQAQHIARLFYGNPDNSNTEHKRIWDTIERGRYEQPLRYFYNESRLNRPDNPEKTIWPKSPHGVYAIAQTYLPAVQENVYLVLFSRYPETLSRLLLDSRNDAYPKRLFEHGQIRIIDGYRQSDIMVDSIDDTTDELDFSWALKAIKRNERFEDKAHARHGILTREDLSNGDILFQNGAHVFWLEKTPRLKSRTKESVSSDNKYIVRYLCNPEHQHSSLVAQDGMECPRVRGFFKLFSLRLNKTPVSRDKAINDITRPAFFRFSKKMHEGEDPYQTFGEEKGMKGFRRLAHSGMTIGIRNVQKASVTLFNMGASKIISILAVSSFLSIAAFVAFNGLLLAASTTRSIGDVSGRVLRQGSTGFFRAFSRLVMGSEAGRQHHVKDFIDLFSGKTRLDLDNVTARNLNVQASLELKPVPLDLMADSFPKTRSYSGRAREKWIKGKTMDTLGGPLGSVYSRVNENGLSWLIAERPDGVKIRFQPSLDIAQVECIDAPYEGMWPDKSLDELRAKLDSDTMLLARDKRQSITMHSPDDMKALISKRKAEFERRASRLRKMQDYIAPDAGMRAVYDRDIAENFKQKACQHRQKAENVHPSSWRLGLHMLATSHFQDISDENDAKQMKRPPPVVQEIDMPPAPAITLSAT